jgi:hypothetical protein
MKCKIDGVNLVRGEMNFSETSPSLSVFYNFTESKELGAETHGGCENHGPWSTELMSALNKFKEVLEREILLKHFTEVEGGKKLSALFQDINKEPESI